MSYTDHKGLVWERSDDRTKITCQDGRIVLGTPEMTDEYLVSLVYLDPPKTDADRIAELEAQVKALLAKLS